MAKRLLPFNQIAPHDQVGLFSLETGQANTNTTDSGSGDDGVFVKISAADWNKDSFEYKSWDAYAGKTDYPHVGRNQYPVVPLTVTPTVSGDVECLGVTLQETAMYDENGEKLIYYRRKKDELHAAAPGQTVAVATRGILQLSSAAFDGTLTPGSGFKLSTNGGKITGCAVTDSAKLGLVVGTGSRSSQTSVTDAFEGNFAVVALRL